MIRCSFSSMVMNVNFNHSVGIFPRSQSKYQFSYFSSFLFYLIPSWRKYVYYQKGFLFILRIFWLSGNFHNDFVDLYLNMLKYLRIAVWCFWWFLFVISLTFLWTITSLVIVLFLCIYLLSTVFCGSALLSNYFV